MTTTDIPPGMMKMGNGRLVPVSKPFGSTAKKIEKKLLLVIQFYEGDRADAEDLALLIAQLEKVRNHEADVLLMRRADSREMSTAVRAKLAEKFDKVHVHACRRTDAKGYPFAPNQMFSDLVTLMAHSAPFATDYYAFVNLETDCTPTRPGWIGEMKEAWKSIPEGKSVLGFVHHDPVEHLNGVAIWATDILRRIPQLIGSNPQIAYDIWHSKRIFPFAATTPLIYFHYRQPTITSHDLFAAGCALYHGVKDGSARAAVRARYITFTESALIQHKPDEKLAATNLSDPKSMAAGAPLDEPLEQAPLTIPAKVEEKIQTLESLPPSVKRPNVYTYAHKHSDIGKIEMDAILEAWRTGWTAKGWNPVILGIRDAAKHPKFDDFQAAVEKLPCITDKRRMAHRLLRWLALDTVGGGLMTDWDVLPEEFTPAQLDPEANAYWGQQYGEKLLALSLSAEESQKWVGRIISYDAQPEDTLVLGVAGKPHVSDTHIAKRHFENAKLSMGEFNHFETARVGNTRKSVAMTKFLRGE